MPLLLTPEERGELPVVGPLLVLTIYTVNVMVNESRTKAESRATAEHAEPLQLR